MSAAPFTFRSTTPAAAANTPLLPGAFIVPPVPRASRSSSSPLRGCGRSTWTRSSPTATRPFAEQPPRKQRIRVLPPAPGFIERLPGDQLGNQRVIAQPGR